MVSSGYRQPPPGYVVRKRSHGGSASAMDWEMDEDMNKQRRLVPAPSPNTFGCVMATNAAPGDSQISITRHINQTFPDSVNTFGSVPAPPPSAQMATTPKSRPSGNKKKKQNTAGTVRSNVTTDVNTRKLEPVSNPLLAAGGNGVISSVQSVQTSSGAGQKYSMSNITSANLVNLARGVENISAVMQRSVQHGGPFRAIQMPEVDLTSGAMTDETGAMSHGMAGQSFGSTPNISCETPAKDFVRTHSLPHGSNVDVGFMCQQTGAPDDASTLDSHRTSENSFKLASGPSPSTVVSGSRVMNGLSAGNVSVVVQSKAPNTISYRPTVTCTSTPSSSCSVASGIDTGTATDKATTVVGSGLKNYGNMTPSDQQPKPRQQNHLEMLLSDDTPPILGTGTKLSTKSSQVNMRNSLQYSLASVTTCNAITSTENCANSQRLTASIVASGSGSGGPLPVDLIDCMPSGSTGVVIDGSGNGQVQSQQVMPRHAAGGGGISSSRDVTGNYSPMNRIGGTAHNLIRPPYGPVTMGPGNKMLKSTGEAAAGMRSVPGVAMVMGGGGILSGNSMGELPIGSNSSNITTVNKWSESNAVGSSSVASYQNDIGLESPSQPNLVRYGRNSQTLHNTVDPVAQYRAANNMELLNPTRPQTLNDPFCQHGDIAPYCGTSDNKLLMSGGSVIDSNVVQSVHTFGSSPAHRAATNISQTLRTFHNNTNPNSTNSSYIRAGGPAYSMNRAGVACVQQHGTNTGALHSLGMGSSLPVMSGGGPPLVDNASGYFQQFQQQQQQLVASPLAPSSSSRQHLVSDVDNSTAVSRGIDT
jgi:hypothetical protein